jgi:LmbE family N-acetylglucosaminyl deacetylase
VKTLKVVIAGGHPGDPEYGCGGTVARYTDLGHSVTLLYLNRGEKGCKDKSPQACGTTRTSEADKACLILHATPRFASQVDGEAIVDNQRYDEFRALLASEEPDIVFTQWPIDHHRDHRAVTTLVYDAWLRMKQKFGLYYYEVSDGEDTQMFAPTEYVDISGTDERKRAACFAHASQTPDRYWTLQSEVARFRGLQGGCNRAEAFVRDVQSRAGFLP